MREWRRGDQATPRRKPGSARTARGCPRRGAGGAAGGAAGASGSGSAPLPQRRPRGRWPRPGPQPPHLPRAGRALPTRARCGLHATTRPAPGLVARGPPAPRLPTPRAAPGPRGGAPARERPTHRLLHGGRHLGTGPRRAQGRAEPARSSTAPAHALWARRSPKTHRRLHIPPRGSSAEDGEHPEPSGETDAGRTWYVPIKGTRTCQLKGRAPPCAPTETGGVASGRSSGGGQQGALSAEAGRGLEGRARREVLFHPSHECPEKLTHLPKG